MSTLIDAIARPEIASLRPYAARGTSGLGLDSFMHGITVQRASTAALAALGPAVMQLARMEGLEAHARAVCMRLEQTP